MGRDHDEAWEIGRGLSALELGAALELKDAGLQLEAAHKAWVTAKERHQRALGNFHRATGATPEPGNGQ